MKPAPSPGRPLARSALVVGLFSAVFAFSAHAWLVHAWGSPVPFWDQWDIEARKIYLSWAEGRLRWADLFVPHNEHRLVLTHLQNLFLIAVNGRWDPLAQMLVNAGWLGLIAGLLTTTLRHLAPTMPRVLIFFVPVLLAAPYGWQNTLWGFQSQHYFALLFGLIAGLGLGLAAPFSVSWWTGVVAGCLAPLSSASGGLASVALLSTLTIAAATDARTWRQVAPSLIAAGGLLLVALAWRVDPPGAVALKVRSLAQFIRVWLSCVAWPNIDASFAAPLAFAPFAIWVFKLRHNPRRGETLTIPVLFLGSLALVHATALSYARGNGLVFGTPLSRYQDSLALGALANLLALRQLRPDAADPLARQRWNFSAALWLVWFGLGLARLTWLNFGSHLPFQAEAGTAQLQNLTAYLTTHDPATLADKGLYEISHSSVADLRAVLDSPTLRPLLPVELQPPGSPRTGLEQFVRGVLTVSPGLFFASLAVLIFAVTRGRPPAAARSAAE